MNTLKYKINFLNPEPEILAKAAEIIKNGGLVAFPTETVYGLGADALNPDAVKKIYIAKGRPANNPLILHINKFEQADKLVYIDERAEKLMKKFWPGPLTLVLKAKEIVPEATRGGLETAALRMPDNFIAAALIEKSGVPIAAPSANISGRPSPTDIKAVIQDMDGKIDMILDGGEILKNIGIESTVIDVSDKEPLLLRAGGTPRELIDEFLLENFNETLGVPDDNSKRRSPGTRYRHYAPEIPVKICYFNDKKFINLKDNNFIEFKNNNLKWGFMGLHEPEFKFGKILIFNSLEDYARGLFTGFRNFEAEGLNGIAVEWPPENGVGLGLRDRILRAAGAL